MNWWKHGITFDEARNLWNDENKITIPTLRIEDGEPRYALLSKYKGEIWRGVFTYRGKKIRIVSVRQTSGKDVRTYKAAQTD